VRQEENGSVTRNLLSYSLNKSKKTSSRWRSAMLPFGLSFPLMKASLGSVSPLQIPRSDSSRRRYQQDVTLEGRVRCSFLSGAGVFLS
jgi:hypothetical protein